MIRFVMKKVFGLLPSVGAGIMIGQTEFGKKTAQVIEKISEKTVKLVDKIDQGIVNQLSSSPEVCSKYEHGRDVCVNTVKGFISLFSELETENKTTNYCSTVGESKPTLIIEEHKTTTVVGENQNESEV